MGPGGDVARVAALQAGLPVGVPGLTVDRQCGSGLAAVVLAVSMLRGRAGRRARRGSGVGLHRPVAVLAAGRRR